MHENLFARSGLSLDRLRSFRQIVEAGGISAASKHDPNRQSQFSRQLRELEKFFGVELVRRGRGPLALTEEGRELDRLTESLLGAFEEFLLNCSNTPVRLVVGAGESLIQWWILPRLPRQDAGQRRWTFTFENQRTDEILHRVLDGSIDLGVVTREVQDSRLHLEALGKLEYALFIPSSLSADSNKLKGRHVMKGLPMAFLSSGNTVPDAVVKDMAHIGAKPNIVLRLSSYPQLAAAVREGKAAAIMPTLAASSLLGTDYTMLRPAFLNSLSRSVSLVWNRTLVEVRPSLLAAGRELKSALAFK